MLSTSIVAQAQTTLWYIIPAAILVAFIKSAWFKGLIGEFVINVSARLLLDKNKYHLIKNVTLPTNGGSTQIDHIIVSEFGVFVLETKNMKGWIFGSAHQKTWTQKIYKHTSKFQNPLHQNYKHVKTLQALLGLTDEQIHSLIIFVGNSTFKTPMPDNVSYGAAYIRYIKSKKTPVLSHSQVMAITKTIQHGRLAPSLKTNREHVQYVKNIKSKNSVPQCLKCGSKMILREAKRGTNVGNKFWGCPNYPGCRGVKSL